jgi:hypothetical protein
MRVLVIACAALLSMASSQPPRRTQARPTAPMYGGGGGGGGGQNPGYPAAGGYYCYTLETGQTTTSECGRSVTDCDQLRQAAEADGMQTSQCVAWTPVACFQLQADGSGGAEVCAANLEDCETWRRIDKEQTGVDSAACAERQ